MSLLANASFAEPKEKLRDGKESQVFTYVRQSEDGYRPETKVRIEPVDGGYRVISRTQRGNLSLTLTARFDACDELKEATVTTVKGPQKLTASAHVADGKARVDRAGKDPVVFDCPRGVIVTSAPDWTDAILAVHRWKPDGPRQQKFPGLWIHPTKAPLRLTFSLTREKTEAVTRQGRAVRLDRLRLELRGGSRYIVWRNPKGQLVRLIPQGKPRQGIILSGWEKASRGLK